MFYLKFEFNNIQDERLKRKTKWIMSLLNKCCTQICFTALYFEWSFKSMWAGGAIFLLLLLLLCFPSLTIIIFRFFSVKLNAHKLQPFVNCSANKHFRGLVLLSSFLFALLCFVVVVFSLDSAVRISQSKCVCKFF